MQSIELETLNRRKHENDDVDIAVIDWRDEDANEDPESIVGTPQDSRSIEENDSDSSSEQEDDDHRHYPDGGIEAYLVVLGSFFGCIVNLGIINSIGAIQVYVSDHQLSNVKPLNVSWIFSIYLCLSYLFCLVTGNIFDRHGPKGLLIACAAFIFLGLMGAANSTKVWQFVLSFISMGVGNGLGMAPLISVISHWFLKKRGNCTGIATSGGSIGGLVFPLLLRHLYAEYGFVWAIRIFAFICLGCMLISIALVKGKFKKPKHSIPHESESLPQKKTWRSVLDKLSQSGFGILKKPKYVFIILGGFFAELSLVVLLTYYATYAIAKGVTESESYLLLTVWNGTGILGRWVPGYISDIYGRFNVNIVMLLLFNIFIFVIWLPFGSHLKALYVFAGLGGYALGSILSLLPACLAQVTPVNEIGTNYGMLNAFLSLGNLFGVPIASLVIGGGTAYDCNMFVVFTGCLSVLGTIFWVLGRYTLVGFSLTAKV